MEDIARAAGVSRPIVYEHFESKEGVYIACVERARVSFEKTLARVVELEASPRDQIAMGASALFSTLESDPGRWLLLFGSNAVLPGQHSARLAALRFTTIAQIEFLLRAGNPDAPTATLSACAHAISGVGERLGHWWLSKPELSREDIEHHYCHVVEAIVDQCLGGLGK
jgi:AcrR family transcriptional regulator